MSTAVATSNGSALFLEKLMKLPSQRSRREFLKHHRNRLRLELIIQIEDRARELLRVDARESRSLATVAVEVARILDDRLAKAHAVRSMANAEYALGHYRAAIGLYDQAIQLFDALGEKTELGRTLSVSILSLNLSGEYHAAFAAAERARKLFAELRDELRLARLDINLGNIYYRQDRFLQALDCYGRAYRVVLDHHDHEGIAVVLSNLAVCLIGVGEFPEALRTYQEAREVCEKHRMPRLVAQADYNIAYLYFLRGEYSRAIDMLRSTRVACEKVDDRYHHALCNLDLSEIYLELNLSAEAAELARQANAEFESLGMGYERAKSLAFEAMAMAQLERPRQSLRAFKQSRAMFVQERNYAWPSLIDLYRALVLFNEGRLAEARRLARAALRVFDSSLLPAKGVLCRLLLARIAQRTGDLPVAHAECTAALDKLKGLQAPMLQHQALLLMGHIQAACGKQQDAYSCFRASRQALESLRSNVRGQELKLAFLKNRLEVYEVLVDACLRHPSEPSLQEAFHYIEEAKSRILMDQMLRPAAVFGEESGQGTPMRRIGNLREELNLYYSLIELEHLRPEQGSPKRLQRLEAQARSRESELVRVLHHVSSAEAVQVGMPGRENVALEKIRKAMPGDALTVEYFQSGDQILVCLLNQKRLEIVPVTLASRISGVLRLLHFQLSKFRLGPDYIEVFCDSLIRSTRSHLESLYHELLAPLRSRLDTPHLLIVPHGALHYVPFHALFDGCRYVIDDYTISYAPSASVYSVCVNKRGNTSGPTLLMGVPDENAPLISAEIESLKAILPSSRAYLGASATDGVLRSEGPDSRIVHIATHGYFRRDSPMFSSIRLGDSYLALYDLYRLRLPVELVTLSGCATGLNVVAAGDELIGLARGLFQAGAQSLLLSLWDVHDASTAEFMKEFYSGLCRGSDKAAAVKQAMLKVRERFAHPYHWAPFVLMGGYTPLAGA